MKCVKCSKRTGATINDMCATCHELWLFEKERFKQAIGYAPEPQDFADWIFKETSFYRRILSKKKK